MTSFDDLLKFSNNMSLIRAEDVDPMASAIWTALIADYYSGLEQTYWREGDFGEKTQPPGITMRTMNLKTVPLDYAEIVLE